MFNAYEYSLLRQGLRLLEKACAAYGDIDGIKGIHTKLDAVVPSKLLSSLQGSIILPKGESNRNKSIYVFEAQRELLTALLPYVLKEPRNILVLFPGRVLARQWAEGLSDKLSDASRRLVLNSTMKLEFINGSTADFGSTKQTYQGFHYDAIFILNHLASE